MKYRNFKRLSNVGPIHGGLESVLTLLFVAGICSFLAFLAIGNTFFTVLFLIPVVACLYGAFLDVRGMLAAKRKEQEHS